MKINPGSKKGNIDIMVSVCMITYNHGLFIKKAIESVIQQKTSFNIELVISDDSSSDNTKSICEEYVSLYPGIIRMLPSHENIGVAKNFKKTIQACSGKYIAFCEGDDYWTDRQKLKKQVEFLEANPAFSLSSTRYKIYNSVSNTFEEDPLTHMFPNETNGIEIDFKVFFSYWITKTLTVIVRRSFIDIGAFDDYQYFRDTHLFYHVLKQSPGYCHNFKGGVYNIHETGVWSSQDKHDKLITGYNVFHELYKANKKDQLLKIKYLEVLRALIDEQIERKKKPLFNQSIYKHLAEYLTIIKSYPFLSDKLKKMWSNTFTY